MGTGASEKERAYGDIHPINLPAWFYRNFQDASFKALTDTLHFPQVERTSLLSRCFPEMDP